MNQHSYTKFTKLDTSLMIISQIPNYGNTLLCIVRHLGDKEKVKTRLHLRVGNEKSINIQTEYWIPCIRQLTYNSIDAENLNRDEYVDHLIDHNTKWRDLEKVRRLFPPQATVEVIKIAMSTGDHEDKLLWKPQKDGKYSVKSICRLFKEMGKENQKRKCSNARRQQRVWKELWKLQIPIRIKLFAWSACKGGLPTKHVKVACQQNTI